MGKHPQRATLWSYQGVDMNNLPSYNNLGSFDVRWEQEQRLITDNNGNEMQGNGTIYFPEKVFSVGDFIVEGEHIDTTPIKGSYEIKNERSISNLSGTEWEYRALV